MGEKMIRVKDETIEKLKEHAGWHESYDTVFNKVLDRFNAMLGITRQRKINDTK